ncbi:MAG: hypothetical protein R3C60_14490 [Parvularculaceae bacterium]
MKPRQQAADAAAAAETEAMRARAGDRIGRIIDSAKRELAGAAFARAAKRAATLQLGVIRTDDGGAVDCDILDLTASGMRIGLREEIALPDRFVVLLPARRQKFIVARRWERAQFIGVEIIGRSSLASAQKGAARRELNSVAADERGGTSLEYALIIALIAALLVLNISLTGGKSSAAIQSAASALDGSAAAATPSASPSSGSSPSPSPAPTPTLPTPASLPFASGPDAGAGDAAAAAADPLANDAGGNNGKKKKKKGAAPD